MLWEAKQLWESATRSRKSWCTRREPLQSPLRRALPPSNKLKANTAERAVIDQQFQLMQTTVQVKEHLTTSPQRWWLEKNVWAESEWTLRAAVDSVHLLFRIYFRPTSLGFRQVVQHVRLRAAEISELINWRQDGRLLIEWPQKWTGGPIHSPKKNKSVTKQNRKTKPNQRKNTQAKQAKTHSTKTNREGESDRQTSYITSVIE